MFSLSARLYEVTGNSTYLDTAEQSIQFMQTYMVKPANSDITITNIFDPTSCTLDETGVTSDDVGPYIEGLSIVANITTNQTYTQVCVPVPAYYLRSFILLITPVRLNELIPAVLSFRTWHSGDGILTEGTRDGAIAAQQALD